MLTAKHFKENQEILFDRFPKIGFLLRDLSLSKIPKIKSDWIQTKEIENADALYIYGLGLGESYLQLKEWLGSKRSLIYIEDNPSHLATFLHTEHAKGILQDPKVHLYFLFPNEKEALTDELAQTFPVKRIEALAAPHKTKKKFFETFRLDLFRKTTLSEGLLLDRFYSYIPFANTVANFKRLPSSFMVNQWKGAFTGIPAILCGAGPSLKNAIPQLKTLQNKALIIAGGSAIAALTSQGVQPHLGIMVDPNHEELERCKASFGFEIPMIYHLRTKKEIFSTFNGPTGYLRSAIASVADIWLEEELGVKGPLIGEKLSKEALSVTSLSLAMAIFFGCSPIILAGVDLAYSAGKRYAEGVTENNTIQKDTLIAEDRIVEKNGLLTNVRWVMEASVLSAYAKRFPKVSFFNASSGLSIPHFKPLKEIDFLRSYDLSGMLYAQIQKTKFSTDQVGAVLEKLKASLLKCQEFASILVRESAVSQESGRMVVAQMDLEEEIAYQVLFYDTLPLLSHYIRRENPEGEPVHEKWKAFQLIVNEYIKLFIYS
ncbi:MAG TPA: 6-hydroxymethylpterin diphosphokinase MptE-like protein [Chlamydiales bacterium]|nr:6-hydroxymethylpterin diphosphokinase MptE-like protein [Chlamydiales bacterium]